MPGVSYRAVAQLVEALQGDSGAGILLPDVAGAPPGGPEVVMIRAGNIAPDVAERSAIRYPVAYVYCDKITNTLREKFRVFSGTARLVIEIRVSQDGADGIEDRLRLAVEEVLGVLHGHRGDWGEGVHYSGMYEVTFLPVKAGGRGLLQVARVSLEVHINTN